VLDRSLPESPQIRRRLPNQRWQFYPQNVDLAEQLAVLTNLSPLISQLLINRGIATSAQAQAFLDPESIILPQPLEEFPDLALSVELLQEAIASQSKIAICGDYDADGMTSTALLLRSLRALGALVDYAIPSRMQEGYGINKRIVEEFHSEGVKLILTVDNGISAYEAIARAKELGLKVIVTDHHDIPQQLPPADAILNPKLIAESSPYRGVAGVGVAYILAVSLAQQLGEFRGLIQPMLELFTLGTIADLAPLTGVNRRWVKRGLKLLPKSKLPGVQALIQIAGVQAKDSKNSPPLPTPNSPLPNSKSLKPEDIGFRLGPRINAVGRIGDPQTVIDLLTTDDMGVRTNKYQPSANVRGD
jgi:single-stranded-DNA-specific exonuclease